MLDVVRHYYSKRRWEGDVRASLRTLESIIRCIYSQTELLPHSPGLQEKVSEARVLSG